VFRTIFILPLMVSPVAVGLIWRYLYDARIGLINHYLEAIGKAIPFCSSLASPAILWLADP
jgi:multiple sugar transport system permease protein